MNIVEYVDELSDEFEGAARYINKAILCKEKNPERAAKFARMSEAELGHAHDLITMFEKDFDALDDAAQDILGDSYESLEEMYVKRNAEIKYMHQTYADK